MSLNVSGLAAVWLASGEPAPNTVGTSMAAFSSTMFAVEKSPTVQPARVNGTHGAGVMPLVRRPAGTEGSRPSTAWCRGRAGGFVFVSMIGRRPVRERGRRVGRPVGVVGLVRVRQRLAMPVAVQTGVDRQAVVRRVRDQRRVRVREHGAVLLQEVQQVRHLLEVGRDVRVVPREVDVVEDDVDHVRDAVAVSWQLAAAELLRPGEASPSATAVARVRPTAANAVQKRLVCGMRTPSGRQFRASLP